MSYVWGDLITAVRVQLTKDRDIIGLEDFITQNIKAATSELQSNIPSFQANQTQHFSHEDLAEDTCAHMGSLLGNVRTTEWWMVDAQDAEGKDARNRRRLHLYPWGWQDRFDLLNGCPKEEGRWYLIAPDRRDFYVYPKVQEDRILVVHFNGIPVDYDDLTTTAFPQDPLVIQAIYAYVKACIMRDIEQNPSGALAFYNEQSKSLSLFHQCQLTLFLNYEDGAPK